MKINFSKEDIQDIRDIVEEYRNVSDELSTYKQEAEKIQNKLYELNDNLKSIKEKEEKKMSELHCKYGDFGLQDIYDTIYDGRF